MKRKNKEGNRCYRLTGAFFAKLVSNCCFVLHEYKDQDKGGSNEAV